MKTVSAFLPLLGIVLSAVVAQDPVPTRIKATLDGVASGYPQPVDAMISLNAGGPAGPEISLYGGQKPELGLFLVGTKAVEFELPMGAVLLVEPLVVLPGVFSSEGMMSLPIDLFDRRLIGMPFYIQGVHYSPPEVGEIFQMTQRLEVTYVEGNLQPPLYYKGPPLTATLVRTKAPERELFYEAVTQFYVPTGGYELRLVGIDQNNGVTHVYLLLEAPNPDEIVSPDAELKRLVVGFGDEPRPNIELLVMQTTRGMQNTQVFQLAALLERDY